jgi:hypothetical protein
MSTALATQVSAAGTPVDKLFDFAASHARATNRLKKALDGNGASATDFETLSLTQHMQGIYVTVRADITWTSSSRVFAGTARGDVRYVHQADLETVYRQRFDEYSERPELVDAVVGQIACSPEKGFAVGDKIDLGAIPTSYASSSTCTNCAGAGTARCTNYGCYLGKVTCMACNGTRVVIGYRIACSNCTYGKVNCSHCHGSQMVGCAPCARTGLFTTLWTGRLHAKVRHEIHNPAGQREDWTKALTRSGHSWLATEGFVSPAKVVRRVDGASVGWDVKVPVLSQKFRIKGTAYDAQYVGRRERMWKVPRFLDNLLYPLTNMVGRAQGAEAFALSRNAPVLDAVRNVVLHNKRSDEAVAGDFENAVTTDLVGKARRHLEACRDGIASSTIRSVWNYAAVSLTVGALAALASGQFRLLLAAFDPAHQRTDPGSAAALVGGVLLAALLGLTYLLAGLAGRSAVRTVLETKADRLPSQGRTPAIAAGASLAIYAACACLIGTGTSSPAAATRPSPAVSSLPHVPQPKIPFVPSR